MRRTSICDKTGLKRGAWTPEEDRLLANYISKYGSWNWTQIPRFAGLSRCGKSCRLRWLNYLKPNIRRGNYTIEEEDLIIQMHEKLGNKWSRIAAALPAGRTDNEIKNYWHTHLHKRAKLIGKTKEGKPKPLLPIEIQGEMQSLTSASSSSEPLASFSTLSISSPKSCDFSSSITHCKAETIEEIDVKYESVAAFDEEASYNGNIWDDPSLLYPMSPLSDSWYWYDHKLHVSFDN